MLSQIHQRAYVCIMRCRRRLQYGELKDARLSSKSTWTGALMSSVGSIKTREGDRCLSWPESWPVDTFPDTKLPFHAFKIYRRRLVVFGVPNCDLASFEGERVAQFRNFYNRGCCRCPFFLLGE